MQEMSLVSFFSEPRFGIQAHSVQKKGFLSSYRIYYLIPKLWKQPETKTRERVSINKPA